MQEKRRSPGLLHQLGELLQRGSELRHGNGPAVPDTGPLTFVALLWEGGHVRRRSVLKQGCRGPWATEGDLRAFACNGARPRRQRHGVCTCEERRHHCIPGPCSASGVRGTSDAYGGAHLHNDQRACPTYGTPHAYAAAPSCVPYWAAAAAAGGTGAAVSWDAGAVAAAGCAGGAEAAGTVGSAGATLPVGAAAATCAAGSDRAAAAAAGGMGAAASWDAGAVAAAGSAGGAGAAGTVGSAGATRQWAPQFPRAPPAPSSQGGSQREA